MRKDVSARRGSKRGFTLLETLIAMLIMSGAILVIAQTWSGNANRLYKARINNTVAYLLQRKITEIEIEYKDKPLEEVKDEDGGVFEKDFPEYSWVMKSQEFDFPDLSGMLSAKDGGANEMLIQVVQQMTEYFKKAVKEVTVTIIFKSKSTKREIRNSATTYFVDYKKEVPFEGMMAPGGGVGAGSKGKGP